MSIAGSSSGVDETRFLIHALRLETSLVLSADRPRIAWTDAVTNLSARPATMQLYHVNLGPPLLGAGAEVVAAIDELAPRDASAAADVATWNRYASPRASPGRPTHPPASPSGRTRGRSPTAT